MKIKIYHSDPPDFLAQRKFDEFPDGYEQVAEVEAMGLDAAFTDTNSIDDYWGKNANVTLKTNKECRSSSVGDVFQVVGGNYYRCAIIGWKEFTPRKEEKE